MRIEKLDGEKDRTLFIMLQCSGFNSFQNVSNVDRY